MKLELYKINILYNLGEESWEKILEKPWIWLDWSPAQFFNKAYFEDFYILKKWFENRSCLDLNLTLHLIHELILLICIWWMRQTVYLSGNSFYFYWASWYNKLYHSNSSDENSFRQLYWCVGDWFIYRLVPLIFST